MSSKSPFNRRGVIFGTAGARKVVKATRAHERAVKSRSRPIEGARGLLPTWNAIVRTTITARSGRVKGKGTVDLLADDGTGTGTDVIAQTGLTAWNPFLSAIVPSGTSGTDRQVVVASINGLLQVIGGDCPI